MSFQDIRGQEKPIKLLKSFIGHSSFKGGYLFTGPEGVGKKLTAIALAKTLNCLNSALDYCGICESCRKIDNLLHPDVHIIANDDSSEIGIDSIRQLQKDIALRPYEGKAKVFIVDDAHRLTAEASNALLKTLEEPPASSVIILISDKPTLIFKTVASRCKNIKFAALRRADLESFFRKDYGFDHNTAHFLSYFSEGRLGEALKLKDTDIFNEKNAIIDRFTKSARIDLENLPLQNKEDVRGYLGILSTWFRDMYLLKVGLAHTEIINLDRKDELLKAMGRFSFSDLNLVFESITWAISSLEQNINTRLLLFELGAQIWKA